MLRRIDRILEMAKKAKTEESHAGKIEDPYEFEEESSSKTEFISSSKTEFISPSISSEARSTTLEIDKRTTEDYKKNQLSETVLSSKLLNLRLYKSPEIPLQQKIDYYLESLPSTEKKKNSDGDAFNVEKASDVSSTEKIGTRVEAVNITDQHDFNQDVQRTNMQVSGFSSALEGKHFSSQVDDLTSDDDHLKAQSATKSNSKIFSQSLNSTEVNTISVEEENTEPHKNSKIIILSDIQIKSENNFLESLPSSSKNSFNEGASNLKNQEIPSFTVLESMNFHTNHDQSDSDDTTSENEYLSSGSEYLPSSSDHSPPGSYSCSETKSTSELTPEKLTTTKDYVPGNIELPNYNTKKNSMAENIFSSSSLKNVKNDLCPFCFEEIGHFSRHLERKHSDEEAVKKIMAMEIKSSERRNAIILLRRKGNFIFQKEKNVIKPVRKPVGTDRETKLDNINYLVCVNCFGTIKSSYLWRHRKHCKANKEHIPKHFKHCSDSQTFSMCTGLLGDFLNKSRLIEIFKIIRADEIGLTIRSDPLICLYGESLLGKHKRRQMHTVISQKMRRMAKVLIALKESTTISNFLDALKPEIYNYILAASKVVSKYDPSTLSFGSPSLALQLGTELKFMCHVAKKAVTTKNPVIGPIGNREIKRTEISELNEMIAAHWCNDIGSLANKVLNENKVVNPKLLPTTQDVSLFHKYTSSLANQAYEKIMNKVHLEDNYNILTKCTLALLVLFNRRRIGEIQFLDIESYERPPENINQEEMVSCLSEFEKYLCKMFKRVVVFGKGSKPVPILFSKNIQKYMDLIIHIRRSTKFVPEDNKYVFATSGSTRWIYGPAVLQKLARECGAQQPQLLTSTRFRKQIATILQLMSFENDELLQVAKFMGHTEKTHTEFYRLTDNTYQTAKVAKILMLLESGKGAELKGKSLNDITFDSEELISEDLIKCNDSPLASGIQQQDQQETTLKLIGTREESLPTISEEESIGKRATRGRIKWESHQKKIVLEKFKKHVQKKIAPKKHECLKLIQENPDDFQESDWVRIKTLVFNTYRDK